MVSAELEHNPFLLETRVLFNGLGPRINSAIERRARCALFEWVSETPRIFHDEMNGYDFDLFFSGTESDYADIKEAFEAAGVPEGKVRFFHKRNLKGALEKWEASLAIVEWLKSNPDPQFDFDRFMQAHHELLDFAFPLVLLHASASHETAPFVRVEPIDSVSDLGNTDLHEIPILIFVSPESAPYLRDDIRWFGGRGDVSSSQLYFAIHPLLDSERVTRIIEDLGIEKPRIVSGIDDPLIQKYMQNCPVTSYVRYAIESFSEEVESISKSLEASSEEAEQSGAVGRARIDAIEREISQLKAAEDFFTHLPNLNESQWFGKARWEFVEELSRWRSRKTKIQGEREVQAAAAEYGHVVERSFSNFTASIEKTFQIEMNRIRREFSSAYSQAEVDSAYSPDWIEPQRERDPELPDIEKSLSSLTQEGFIEPRNDIFSLFSPANLDEEGRIRIVFCYIDKWRDRTLELTAPILDSMISSRLESLSRFYVELADRYEAHIEELTKQRMATKDVLATRLSSEEQTLQRSFDWLTAFKDQLHELKRG